MRLVARLALPLFALPIAACDGLVVDAQPDPDSPAALDLGEIAVDPVSERALLVHYEDDDGDGQADYEERSLWSLDPDDGTLAEVEDDLVDFGWISHVAYGPDRVVLQGWGDQDTRFRALDRDSLELADEVVLAGHYRVIGTSPSGQWLLMFSYTEGDEDLDEAFLLDLSTLETHPAPNGDVVAWMPGPEDQLVVVDGDVLRVHSVDGAEVGQHALEIEGDLPLRLADTSPDGQTMAFDGGDRLYLVDLETGDTRSVDGDYDTATFTPDSSTIVAYERLHGDDDRDSDKQLVAIDAASLEIDVLLAEDQAPVFYTVTREGSFVVAVPTTSGSLTVHDLDAGTATRAGNDRMDLDQVVTRPGTNEMWFLDRDDGLYVLDLLDATVEHVDAPFLAGVIAILPAHDRLVLRHFPEDRFVLLDLATQTAATDHTL